MSKPIEIAQTSTERIYKSLGRTPGENSEVQAIIEAAIAEAVAPLQAELANEKASNYALTKSAEEFHLRIYDTFTCPNCRGQKTQFPGFMAESNELVPCEICGGEGWVRLADLMEGFQPKEERDELAALLERVERVRELRSKYVIELPINPFAVGGMKLVGATLDAVLDILDGKDTKGEA